MNDKKPILALDIGGSSIKSGLVNGETVQGQKKTIIDSRASREKIIATFSTIIQSYFEKEAIEGVAFSIPGPFDYDNGISYIDASQNKYGAIYGVNLKKELIARLSLSCPISFRNDGESAVVGEALFGVGKPFGRLLGITLGTGFGSAFIEGGRPQIEGIGIPKNKPLYDCMWNNQRADDVFSIRGLESRLKEIGFTGTLKTAAEKGKTDSEIRRVFEFWGDELGQFLKEFTDLFGAEALIVQGGLSGAFELFMDSLQNNLTAKVLKHTLAEKAALLGAAEKFHR